jgi:hypothetical protein
MRTLLNYTILIIAVCLIMCACGDKDNDSFSAMDILPESVKDSKFPQDKKNTVIEETGSEPKTFDEILGEINKDNETSYNPHTIDEIKKQINKLNSSYTTPLIIRENDIRLRTYPYLNSDVKAILKTGSRIIPKKRTSEKKVDAYGNKHYWLYVEVDSVTNTQKEDTGWIYGGDVFKTNFKYPYLNNLSIIDTDENTEQILIKNAMFRDFKIQKDNVKLKYRPDNYSSTLLTLNKGNSINIREKTVFKQSLNDYDNGRWYYVIHNAKEQGNRLESGWIYEKYLPDEINDELKSKIPYNKVYKAFQEKPAYIGVIEINNESDHPDKEAYLRLICRINLSNGMITDIPIDKAHRRYTKLYYGWVTQSLSDTKFYLYSNQGKELGKAMPILDNENNIIQSDKGHIRIGVRLLRTDAHQMTLSSLLALSMNENNNKAPFSIIEHTKTHFKDPIRDKIEKFVISKIKVKSHITNIDRTNPLYTLSKTLDISVITHRGKEKYLYIADFRLIKDEYEEEGKSYTLRQIGLLNEENEEPIVIEDTFKESESKEALDYISSYKSIIGTIDLNKDGNDEVIIETSDLIQQLGYKILLLGDKETYTIYE